MAGQEQKDDEPITAINITPLVDICLVLVIIFMAVAPFALTVGITVLESRAKAAEGKASADENVQVRLSADGTLTLNGSKVELPVFPREVAKALAASKDKMVIITADDANRVGQVVQLLDISRQAGAVKLAIMKTEDAKPAGKGKT